MGGGFGSKFGADVWGTTAAQLSKKAGGRPVKMFLDRVQEHLAAGNRPSGSAHIKLGANRDGKLVAMIAEPHGTGGVGGGADVILPYVYSVPNTSGDAIDVFTNFGSQRAMRAPRHPQSCALTEAAMDDLADKLGMDPLEFRLKNLPPDDFQTPDLRGRAQDRGRADRLAREAQAARPDGNRADQARPGRGPAPVGRRRHAGQAGLLHDQPGRLGRAQARATQDIGTGARTVLAIIAAEVLGLKPTDIISNIGNSTFPPGQSSGGSTTTPSMAPPCLDAVTKARDALFKKIAPAVKATAEDLSLKDGQLWVAGEPMMSWKDACRKLGTIADLRARHVPAGALAAPASAAASSPRSPSISRPAWSRSRRSSPSRTRA